MTTEGGRVQIAEKGTHSMLLHFMNAIGGMVGVYRYMKNKHEVFRVICAIVNLIGVADVRIWPTEKVINIFKSRRSAAALLQLKARTKNHKL